MTKEEKDLLLRGLCAGLPYGVKAQYYGSEEGMLMVDTIEGIDMQPQVEVIIGQYCLGLESVKPFLRPMPSMTEEESAYLRQRFCFEWGGKSLVELVNNHKIDICDSIAFVNWLYEHHFDPNGLIDNGLAYKAPNGMYNINKD